MHVRFKTTTGEDVVAPRNKILLQHEKNSEEYKVEVLTGSVPWFYCLTETAWKNLANWILR